MDMRVIIRGILLVWFIAVSILILIPSYQLLSSHRKAGTTSLQEPPQPPADVVIIPVDPKLDLQVQEQQVKAYTQQVNAYTQRVTAYTQQVNAYKAYTESATKFRDIAVYQMVVKETLSSLLSGFLTALLSYVFVNAGASLVDNYIRSKNNQALQPIRLF